MANVISFSKVERFIPAQVILEAQDGVESDAESVLESIMWDELYKLVFGTSLLFEDIYDFLHHYNSRCLDMGMWYLICHEGLRWLENRSGDTSLTLQRFREICHDQVQYYMNRDSMSYFSY